MQFRACLLLVSILVCAGVSAAAQNTALPNAPSSTIEVAEAVPPVPDLGREPALRVAPALMPAALVTAAEPPARPKIVDKKFIILGALAFGLTSMDLEFTQRCLHRGTCVELNPTMPHSHLGMYAVNTPTNLAVMYLAYRRRSHGKKDWWVAPVIDIGAHVVGVGSNIRFLGK